MTVTERFLKYVTFETTSDEPMQCATKWAMSMGISLRPMAAKIALR